MEQRFLQLSDFVKRHPWNYYHIYETLKYFTDPLPELINVKYLAI